MSHDDDDDKDVMAKVATIDVEDLKNATREEREDMISSILGDDVPDAVRKALGNVMDQADKMAEGGGSGSVCSCGKVHEPFANVQESMAEVMNYQQTTMPPVGSMVVMNHYGHNQYKLPIEADNETATVIEVFDRYQVVNGKNGFCVYNGIIAVADEKNSVRLYPVDLRCYEQVKPQAPGNGTH